MLNSAILGTNLLRDKNPSLQKGLILKMDLGMAINVQSKNWNFFLAVCALNIRGFLAIFS